MNIVKKILTGGMDGDTELQLVSDDATLNVMNARTGVTAYGRNLQLQNVPGTTAVTNAVYPPYGVSFTIGSCTDDNRNYLIWANANTFNDTGFYAYSYQTGITYVILYDSQVTGGLGLTKANRIDRNMYVIDDLLFWTDGNGEPRCVNYIAGIKFNQPTYTTTVTPYQIPIKYQSTTIIVRPPIYPLTVTKQTDSGFLNNFTQNNAYEFTYQYVFVNYQTSALSAYSEMVPYNYKAETYNNVLVKVPFAEFIDNEVQQINLCVKYGNNGKTFIVKQWNRNNTQDANEIFSHNLGLVQLQFTFYDNVVGIALDDVSSVTSFHNVPLQSKTLVPARNRMFLGYNTLGYNSPTATSLSATTSSSISETNIFKSGGTYKITVAFYDRFRRKCGVVNVSIPINIPERTYTQFDFIYLINWTLSNTNAVNEIPDWAYYYQILWTKNLNKLFYIQGITNFIAYAPKNTDTGLYEPTETDYSITSTSALAVDLSGFNAYGIGYTYADGDFATIYLQSGTNYTSRVIGQQGNLVLLAPVDIGSIINNYKFTFVPFSTVNVADSIYFPATVQYPASNAKEIVQSTTSHDLSQDPPNLGENNWSINILDGLARTYSVKGKVVVEIIDNSVTFPNLIGQIYCTKIPGIITDVTITTLFTQPAVAGTTTINFTATLNVPVAYNRVTFILFCPDVVTVNIISGEMNLTQTDALKLVEIYTPNKENVNENYYEVGDVMDVTNPTLNTRTYSTTSGTITGDSWRILRDIDVEAMSPNDNTWQFWQRSLGWTNSVDTIGQQVKKDSIAFSDTYIAGSKTNGLSTFQPLNQKEIGSDGGQIRKLVLTNKKQEDGTIMLILTDNQCLSVFLGETQVVSATQNTFVSVSDGVIGTINELRGNSGTVNPESVIQYLGLVFWVDANNGWISQYSPNGVDPISRYKQTRFFQNYLKNYLFASSGNLDNINGFHHIAMGIDPFHKEVFVTLPGLIYQNYANTFPSYTSVPSYATSIINRLDISDSLAKTMCFSFEENKWGSNFEYMPEWTDYMQNTLFGFKNGNLYIMNNNTTNWNTFFGTTYPIRICVVVNAPVSGIKNVVTLRLEASVAPDYTVVYSPTPDIQITDLTASDWTNDEGIFDATVFRDRLSPNTTGAADVKLYKGDEMVSATPEIQMEFQQYTRLAFVNFINILFSISRGQANLIKK